MHIVFPLQKGWVGHYRRRSKTGIDHQVSGYWRDEHPNIKDAKWSDCELPRWKDLVKKRTPRLIDPIETVEELEDFLRGLKAVFLSDKDGWAMIPSSYGDMFVSIEPGYYGHVFRQKGGKEADNRIRYFRAVVQTLIQPWEIWRQPVGGGSEDGIMFAAGYHILGEKDKSVVVMVGFRKNKPILWTAIPMSDASEVDKKRHGELLFKDYE